jgi:cyclophilin family peptidyl-prolyl cis-trans isomerase
MLARPAGTEAPEEPDLRLIARPALLLVLVLSCATVARADNPIVRFTTPIGSFDVELCEAVSTICTHGAPNTVANFLSYVDEGAYEGSVIHRSVFNFVLQGGSFYRNDADDVIRSIPPHEAVASEFLGQSNVSGTLSVPLQSDPGSSSPCDTVEDSGTSGFFINVGNNVGLDCGLFTVFGRVTGDGMSTIVAQLHALQRWNLNSAQLNPFFDPDGLQGAFTTAPMLDTFTGSVTDVLPHFVTTNIARVPEPGAVLASAVAIAALAVLTRGRA